MSIYPLQAVFNRGELTPILHARVDLEYFKMSYKYGENFIVTRQGGLMNRPGTKFLGGIHDHTKKARFVHFIFSRTQVYIIEFGNLYLRFWANDGQVISATSPVTGLTKANPGVVTYSGADNVANGDHVLLSGVGGMVEVNSQEFVVAGLNTGANTFQLSGVNTTAYTTYTSGGTVSKIYEVVTPYVEADIPDLQFAQSNDVIYITHKNYAPRKLQRFAETNWTLSTVTLLDGPYLPAPVGSRAVVTSSTNGGPGAATVTGTGGAGITDGVESTSGNLGVPPNTIQWQFGAGKVLNSYIIANSQDNTNFELYAPKNFSVDGSNDGTNWTALDARSDELGWQRGETRYYSFYNVTSYTYYRMVFTNGGQQSQSIIFQELYWGQNGDFAGTITLTFTNTNGINGGIGFQSTDVGRAIRLLSSNDNRYRWFRITAVTDTTHVVGRMYGYPLRQDFNISEWQLGAFSDQSGWPSCVAFYLDRLVFGRTNAKPLGVYISQVGEYENFGVSDPVVDDDSITINIASSETEEIEWISEGTLDLIIGTSVGVRTLGRGDTGKPFSPTNFQVTKQSNNGTAGIIPALVGSALIYPSYHLKSLREFIYSFDVNAYISPEVSILSDHLLKSGIVYMDFANDPEPILWIINGNGELIGLTYDKENKIVGLHRSRVSGNSSVDGTYAVLESVCVIPGPIQDDLWMIVKRTVNSVTKRYVERMTKFNDENVPKEDAWYLDCALEYNGAATSVITGLFHLVGKIVSVYANNTVYAGIVVAANGSVTIPGGVTATRALIGLAYSPVVDLLQPVTQVQDGVSFNRKKKGGRTIIDFFRTKGVLAGNMRTQERIQYPQAGARTENPTELFTGYCPVTFDSRWDDQALLRIVQDKPYPCFIRSVLLTHDGEP